MTHLLLDTTLSSEQRSYAETAKNSGTLLLNLINEILDFSKIEAGKMVIETAEFDLEKELTDLIKLFMGEIRSKGLIFNCSVESDVPTALKGDIVRLRQILNNLLSNAVKFTERGEININVSLVATADTQVTLRFAVKDTGIGIAKESEEKLFLPFTQVDGSSTRKFGGTGLGLVICKQLLDLMGGKIEVETEAGKGSTFNFTLPLSKSSPQRQTAPTTTNSSTETVERASTKETAFHLTIDQQDQDHTPKILIVEDNPINQRVVKLIIERLGFHAKTANDGLTALDMLSRNAFDLILMDCHMPVMDGYETSSVIREREAGSDKHIPIIAITANSMEKDRQRCLEAGMNDFVSKPFAPSDIEKVISKWLGIATKKESAYFCKEPDSKPQEELRETDVTKNSDPLPQTSPSSKNPPSSSLNLQRLKELLVVINGDKAFLLNLLQSFLESSHLNLTTITEKFAVRDLNSVKDAAHSIKGAASNLGAMRILQICKAIEKSCSSNSSLEIADLITSLTVELKTFEAEINNNAWLQEDEKV